MFTRRSILGMFAALFGLKPKLQAKPSKAVLEALALAPKCPWIHPNIAVDMLLDPEPFVTATGYWQRILSEHGVSDYKSISDQEIAAAQAKAYLAEGLTGPFVPFDLSANWFIPNTQGESK